MKIKLLVNENRGIEFSIDEAKLLHIELDKLFNNQANHTTHAPVHTTESHTPPSAVRNPMASSESTAIRNEPVPETITSVKGETKPAPKKKDRYANPRVEAAKERAASRTSGCGSRR